MCNALVNYALTLGIAQVFRLIQETCVRLMGPCSSVPFSCMFDDADPVLVIVWLVAWNPHDSHWVMGTYLRDAVSTGMKLLSTSSIMSYILHVQGCEHIIREPPIIGSENEGFL